MTVPRGNVRSTCNVGRIRSSVPLRPTFVNNKTWYCGTAVAVPYVKLYKVFDLAARVAPTRSISINHLDYSPVSVYNVVICPALSGEI